jgi:hypothetical protein
MIVLLNEIGKNPINYILPNYLTFFLFTIKLTIELLRNENTNIYKIKAEKNWKHDSFCFFFSTCNEIIMHDLQYNAKIFILLKMEL